MKKLLFLFLVLWIFSLEATTLGDKIKHAKKGDYIVTLQNKIYTILVINEVEDNSVIIEEINIPFDKFNKKLTFRKWIENGSSGCTSDMLYRLDLKEYKILDCYSINRESWINISNNESIFSKLLTLNLNKLSKDKRRKIGPAPLGNEIDRRSVWNPPKIVNQKKIKNAKFDCYQTIWPKDDTELSLKVIDIYFNDNFFFPYWIQISTGHISVMLKTIDSGKELFSINTLPKLP